jgi:RNA polymerase sigma factor (sigma-70 family)
MADAGAGELVHAAGAGDQAAWDKLVDHFGGLVWSVARSFRLGDADAADVTQVTWLRLVENLHRIEDGDRVGAWLATTARRECLRLIRQQGRVVTFDDDAVLDDLAPQEAPEPAQRLLAQERDAALWAALEGISPRCQHLLRVLMADPPPSYEEVSAALDMPIGSIGPTRARCLEHLRRHAARVGITDAPGDSDG